MQIECLQLANAQQTVKVSAVISFVILIHLSGNGSNTRKLTAKIGRGISLFLFVAFLYSALISRI